MFGNNPFNEQRAAQKQTVAVAKITGPEPEAEFELAEKEKKMMSGAAEGKVGRRDLDRWGRETPAEAGSKAEEEDGAGGARREEENLKQPFQEDELHHQHQQ